MYRPQFPFPAAPEGFMWQPCVYQFDITNTPALGTLSLAAGQETGHIPLHLDQDACFILRAIKLTCTGFNLLLFDPWSNQLMNDFVGAVIYGASAPLSTILEGGPGIEVPAGSSFTVRIQGQ